MKPIGFHILIFLCLSIHLAAQHDSSILEEDQDLYKKAQQLRFQYPDSSLYLLQHYYAECIEVGDTSNAIRSLMLDASINGTQAKYKESYDKLWKALLMADEANLNLLKVHLYQRIGRYYAYYKRREKALHFINLALTLNKSLIAKGEMEPASLTQRYVSFFYSYLEFGEFQLADTYMDSCFLYLEEENSASIPLPYLKMQQAFLYSKVQQSEKAIALIEEGIPWFEAHKPSFLVLVYTYLGDAYRDQGIDGQGETCYKNAIAYSEEYNSHLDFSVLIYEKLAQLYLDQGQHAKAYVQLEKVLELDRLFFDSRSAYNRPILEIQDEFRREKESREKLLQAQRLAQLEHEDKVLFLQRTILAGSLGFLIIIGIFYVKHIRSKHREEKLKHEKVKEINQIKLRFFTNISHEFKTPLTLILGPLQKLIQQNHIDESVKSSLKMMERNADQMLRLVNQIIEFRKLESTQGKLNASLGDIVYVCREITDSFQFLAEEKRVELGFESLQEEIDIWFDRDKLEKILNNLISNAIKHTPKGGRVRVSASIIEKKSQGKLPQGSFPECVQLVVEDSGKGIPEDQIDRVFDRYYQVDPVNYKGQIGSGIGLALTKELILLHEGEIMLESEEGKGSRFIIHLPFGRQQMDKAGPQAMKESQEILPEFLQSLHPLDKASSQEPEFVSPPPPQDEFPVLLIIEDNADMLVFIREVFEKRYRILEAGNGQMGLEIAFSQVPDLVISDVMMPVMDGIEVCQRLKSHEVTNHIPVILLTARSANEHRIQGFETGADAYIAKPFDPRHLEIRVENLLKQRDALKRKFQKGHINFDSQKFGLKEGQKRFIEKAEQIIEANLTNSEFTVADLGRELGFSRMQLYRKLKAHTGMSANEFIRAYKIKKAAIFLKESHLNITEILYEVGFTNRSYFSKCFKQVFGMSPREYINEHKPVPSSEAI
ncbi:MAG: ATP-binding protein [Bacteroidota bacterium]